MADIKHRSKKVEGLDDNWRKVNPAYNTSALIKAVGDRIGQAMGSPNPKKKK